MFCVPLWIASDATFFPILKLPDFLLSVLNLGLQFLAGFLSRFRYGWSLLSVRRHRKRTVDLLGCPDGSIKFSWGYPLKELRSSAPLFISSWIMVLIIIQYDYTIVQTPFLSLPYLDGVMNGRTGIPLKAWKAEQIRKGVYAILREENRKEQLTHKHNFDR